MSTLSKRQHARSSQGETRPLAGRHQVTPYAAGVEIGAHEIVACVPDGEDPQVVRPFGTYTADLHTLAAGFVERGIQTVAMASTGVSWMPLFEELEARGLRCGLMSAQAIKRVPGRKRDVVDCQWLQTLHRYGLLSASLRPDADLVALRTLLRHRAQRLEHRAPHVLHMPKALLQMPIQLSQARSDVTGDTGQRLIRAMVAGERDPPTLAAFRNYRCKQDADEIARALTGTWREEQLLILKQALALFDFYTAQLRECETPIAQAFSVIQPRCDLAPEPPSPTAASSPPLRKPHSHSKTAPAVNSRAHILRIPGVDLVAVHGISDALAQTILAEIGTEMSKGPTDQHCCSWLGLAPKNDISGGKGIEEPYYQASQACHASLPHGGPVGQPLALRLGRVLSAPHRASWSCPSVRGYGTQDRPDRVSHA